MEPEKEDRRRRRTREALQNALVSLLKANRYEDISVEQIIERADVARSTFYVHYLDKDDLLVGPHGIFAGSLRHDSTLMLDEEKENPTAFPGRSWFGHVQAQGPILRVIAKDPALDLALKTLYQIIRGAVASRFQNYQFADETTIPSSLTVEYITGTFLTLIKWWLKNGMAHSPEQMNEIFQRLVMNGITGIGGK